jgi:phage/plasmid-like protein (TIGR03299 family)
MTAPTLDRIGVPNSTRLAPDGGIGAPVHDALTWEDAVEMADLNWSVDNKPMYYRDGTRYHRITHRKMNVRSDNGAPLGEVGATYSPIVNSELGQFFTPIVNSGAGKFTRAGHFRGGAYVFGSVQLGEGVELDLPVDGTYSKDLLLPMLYMTSSHDGTRPWRMDLVVERLVCTNGLTMPVAARGMVLRHSGDTAKKVEQAHEAIALWTRYEPKFVEAASRLAAKKMTWEDIQAFTTQLFPSKKEQDGEEMDARVQERREALLATLRMAPDLEDIRETAWGVYNAVAQLTDHVLPYKDGNTTKPERRAGGLAADRRFLSIVDGNGPAELKDKAFAILSRK